MKNSRIPNSTLQIKRSRAGLGLFTDTEREKGEAIIEYIGEIISEEEANRRGGKYLFELNDQWTIDGKTRRNDARYINHSCRPNCEAELSEDEWHVYIKARRRIRAGEELTYNYGRAHFREYIEPYGCRCVKCDPEGVRTPRRH